MRESGEGPFTRVSGSLGSVAAERWADLSQRVAQLASPTDVSDLVTALHRAANEDPQAPVAPAFRLWAADALSRTGQDDEAVHVYDETVTSAEAAPAFEGIDLAGEALRHKAGALARLGDAQGAVAALRDLSGRGLESAMFRAGKVAERAGRFDEAVEYYAEVADAARSVDADDLRQQASRAAERLSTRPGRFMPAVVGVAQLVDTAVSSRDANTLRSLASRTHFAAGPGGGHFRFESEEVLDWLCSDLARSRPRRFGRGLQGTGEKRYLFTTGWRGARFTGIVGFCFTRSGRGWEWSGVIVTGPTDPWMKRWAPDENAANQPLPFGLLAPWPRDLHFMAGGLGDFAVKSAAIAAAASIPFVGGAIAVALAFGFSLSDCGFGLRGFYYNEGPTHTGTNAFSIDFTAYRRGVPFDNVSGGVSALAAADGIVRMTDSDAPSGDSSDPNEVQINHDDPGTGAARFVSRYLHMAGPGLVPVSAGMAVPVGSRLGFMDDTGTSVLDHLHFSIHDMSAGPGIGPSVRPNPMESRTLGDEDSGTCIRSTNRETIALPEGCAEIVRELLRAILGGR